MRLGLLALVALLVACSSSASSTQVVGALPQGEVIEKLAAGEVASLPTGSVYVRFVSFNQPPGYVITSRDLLQRRPAGSFSGPDNR